MKKVLILGGEGLGEIIASVIDRLPDMEVLGFINDFAEIGATFGNFKKIPVVAAFDKVIDLIDSDPDIYVTSGYGGHKTHIQMCERIQKLTAQIPPERWVNVIDYTSIIPYGYCRLGKGVFIGPLAQLSANAEISDHCKLLGNAFVGHNAFVEEYCHITSNSVVGAYVRVGKGAHIGTNSVIRERITIGEYSIIGSGSVVVKDVPPYSVVVGNPARLLRMRETPSANAIDNG